MEFDDTMSIPAMQFQKKFTSVKLSLKFKCNLVGFIFIKVSLFSSKHDSCTSAMQEKYLNARKSEHNRQISPGKTRNSPTCLH